MAVASATAQSQRRAPSTHTQGSLCFTLRLLDSGHLSSVRRLKVFIIIIIIITIPCLLTAAFPHVTILFRNHKCGVMLWLPKFYPPMTGLVRTRPVPC
jgi:hypothetical protein